MILLVEKCAAFPSNRKCFPFFDGMVFKNDPLLRLSVCVRVLKSLKRFWPYLMAFRSCISTGKPEKLLHLMFFFPDNSSIVFVASF